MVFPRLVFGNDSWFLPCQSESYNCGDFMFLFVRDLISRHSIKDWIYQEDLEPDLHHNLEDCQGNEDFATYCPVIKDYVYPPSPTFFPPAILDHLEPNGQLPLEECRDYLSKYSILFRGELLCVLERY